VKKAFAAPEVREKFQKQGAQLMLGSPADFTAFVAAESKRWGDVIRKANIKIDN
jgi:tripartite-type tricarboxylate transporter receptor subunit TctC